MPTTYKILGQSSPTANTLTTAYTVPAGTQAVVSTINICNPDIFTRAFRIAVVKSGESIAQKHYICYDIPITSVDSIALTLGVSMGANDSISVYSTATSNISFGIFGCEIT